jgi:ATP-binding cassette, subfamily B, bacterial
MNNLSKSKDEKKLNLFWVIQRIKKGYPIQIFAVLVCIVIVAVTTLIGTTFFKALIDDYITPLLQSGQKDFSNLDKAIVRLSFVCAVGVIASYVQSTTMVKIGQGTMRGIREELFSHMQRLSVSYFDTHPYGDTMSIYTNDVDTLRQFIGVSLPNILSSIISLISVFITMLILNVPLTFLSLGMILIIMFISNKSASISMKHFVRQQAQIGEINAYIEEMMSGQKVIKVFCHEDAVEKDFLDINEKLRQSASKANSYANILMPIINQLGKFSYVIIAIVASVASVKGYMKITVGEIVTFLALVQSFTQPLSQVGQQVNAIIMASAGVSRLGNLLYAQPEDAGGDISLVNVVHKDGTLEETADRSGMWAWKKGDKEYVEVKGDIKFEDVDFSYVEGHTILHDINLYAKPAQKIAFVGSTGAGKTTITNLLNRFYDIDKGNIIYDGIKIRDIKKSDLRKSLGIVLQDTHLFTGTVMENIRYGSPSASDEECIGAARLANAHGFIERLPNSYDTVINADGGSLSQGQRQLLAIARAAVADPPVLILDEATSSIDTHTEKLVQRGMDALMSGRTTFVIAHRLSTIRNADCIMVLEHGEIIERGSHEELLAQKGRYYKLYTGMSVVD